MTEGFGLTAEPVNLEEPEAPQIDQPSAEQVKRRALQYLVHCFLYYKLNESVISDEQFDLIANELWRYRSNYPGISVPHQAIVDSAIGPEGSGYKIKKYPLEIITTAFKLLYALTEPPQTMEGFKEFVVRKGYRVEVDEPKPQVVALKRREG